MSTTTNEQASPARRRPSPVPVTERETALPTPHSAGVPAGTASSAARAGARARVAPETVLTQGHQPTDSPGVWDGLKERLAAYWRPPSVVADPPATLLELIAYARTGEWTSAGIGPVRALGIGYSWLAVAATTVLYYAAWIVQRPGRLATVTVLYGLLAHTPPGAWLPWPGWL
ncbi:hypothetical protein [Micromonospora sp. RV43]|uniref:hypothetical protein n=1 Tax=Micromonospora sp. RV43 TaxID=1661387 RepID=UPI000B0B3DAF|nr:hypothetical protein [Micromonospora sp. RV43]